MDAPTSRQARVPHSKLIEPSSDELLATTPLFQDSNLSNLSATTWGSAQFLNKLLPTSRFAGAVMTSIVLVGIAFFLGVLAIVFKLRAKPKKAEKWEKAQIMRQLLTLSEQDVASGSARPHSASTRTHRRQATASR